MQNDRWLAMTEALAPPPRFSLGPWTEWKLLIGGMGLGWMLAAGGWWRLTVFGYFVIAFLLALYNWRWRRKNWEYEIRRLAQRGPGETVKMNCTRCRRAELGVRRPDGTVFAWDETRSSQVAETPGVCWKCIDTPDLSSV